MYLNEHFLRKAIPEVSLLYKSFPEVPSYSVDTRTLKKGDIFIALEGNHVDGHGFVSEAIKKGANGLIIAENKKECLKNLSQHKLENKCVIIVPDTKRALLQCATLWREHFDYPVIGVTGSVGKTSTKEILCNILDLHGIKYVASYGNQNTAIGLALNVLRMRQEHEVAIFELGINKRNEMKQLVTIAKPTIGLITCIGHAHMEGLGSIVDIAAEKRVIFSLFKENNIGIINGDQTLLAQVSYNHPVIKFGAKTTNQVQARKIRISSSETYFVLKLYGKKYEIRLKSNHSGAVFNALAATSVAYLLQIPVETIIKGIELPLVVTGRFEKRKLKETKGTLINDCYNANPESMKAALLAFEQLDTDANKIAVLGDMLELGVNSPFWHRQLGRFLRKVPSLQKVVLVGDLVKWTKKAVPVGLSVEHVLTWQEAYKKLHNEVKEDSLILVKGSLNVGLGNLVEAMT